MNKNVKVILEAIRFAKTLVEQLYLKSYGDKWILKPVATYDEHGKVMHEIYYKLNDICLEITEHFDL